MGTPLPVLTYHYITFKHFQPWSTIGLQQGMYHIIKFVLLRSRNAIPVVLSEEKRKTYCGVNNGPQLHSNRQFRPAHWLEERKGFTHSSFGKTLRIMGKLFIQTQSDRVQQVSKDTKSPKQKCEKTQSSVESEERNQQWTDAHFNSTKTANYRQTFASCEH